VLNLDLQRLIRGDDSERDPYDHQSSAAKVRQPMKWDCSGRYLDGRREPHHRIRCRGERRQPVRAQSL